MLFVTLALLGAIIGLTYLFLNFNYGYWKKRGVPGPKPQILNGNYPSIFNQKHHMAHDLELIYREYKKSCDFVGIFSCRAPQLLILNPQLVRRVYVTDFKHFHDNETTLFIDEKSDFIFANNPFALSGEKWKERRAEVTPGLTASRIKSVYPVTKKVVKRLTEFIEKEMKMGTNTGTDAKDMCLRFTSDVVSDCVLGINAGSFEEKGSEILTNVKNLFDQSFLFQLYFAMVGLLPWLRGAFRLRFIPKPVETFFFGLMDNAIALRRQQAETQANRADFMNYLLELQKKKNLSNSQLTAHTMTFLLDGFETTASVISHVLLLLGRHQDIQEKLLQEILENVDKNGEIDFDKLNDLPYLDACIHEAIRLFPPAFFGSKLCTEPITLTNKDGSSVELRKNDTVMLPIYSIMSDEEFYPDPQAFKPERFLEEADSVKAMREKGLYYGFGDGPRVCLGMRFALTQTKAALVEIVQNFVVKVNSKTRSDNRFDPKYFLTQIDGGIFLDFERRN